MAPDVSGKPAGVELLTSLLNRDEENPSIESHNDSASFDSTSPTLRHPNLCLVGLSTILILVAALLYLGGLMTNDPAPNIRVWNGDRPPQLSVVRKHQWIACEDYTDAQIDEIKLWEDYWVNHIGKDSSLRADLYRADLGDAVREKIRVKYPKASKTYHACEYYSMGLSGPWNGKPVRPLHHIDNSAKSWLWNYGDDDDVRGAGDAYDGDDTDDGKCQSTDDGYAICDMSWHESLSIIDSAHVSLTATAETEFSFLANHTDCDISADIGGDMFLTFELDTWTYDSLITVDVLTEPAEGINFLGPREMFTLDVDLKNVNSNKCCLDSWWLAITPGYNEKIYSDNVSLDVGLVSLEFSEHLSHTYRSNDCVDTGPIT